MIPHTTYTPHYIQAHYTDTPLGKRILTTHTPTCNLSSHNPKTYTPHHSHDSTKNLPLHVPRYSHNGLISTPLHIRLTHIYCSTQHTQRSHTLLPHLPMLTHTHATPCTHTPLLTCTHERSPLHPYASHTHALTHTLYSLPTTHTHPTTHRPHYAHNLHPFDMYVHTLHICNTLHIYAPLHTDTYTFTPLVTPPYPHTLICPFTHMHTDP